MTLHNDRLVRALTHQPVDRTPIWLMRQAGRSLPEYRSVREQHTLLEICRQPELCAEVTLQPVRRHGVDAAILFADIMLPLIGIGVDLDIVESVGPVVNHPIRSMADAEVLRPLLPDDVSFVTDDIHATLDALAGTVPLIGFSGAPFTLASYLVEGRPSRDFLRTKTLMYSEPKIWEALMSRLASVVAAYLHVQANAGVHALQIFDSWVGALSVDDYIRFVQPYSTKVFESLAAIPLPTIHFGVGAGHLIEAMRDAGGTAIGVDWRVPIDIAWRRIGEDREIQGNLDPMILLAPRTVMEDAAGIVLERVGGRPGHVFNVGHGVHPQTDPNQITRLVEYVHRRNLGELRDEWQEAHLEEKRNEHVVR